MKTQGEFTIGKWDEENLTSFPPAMPVAKASIIFEATGAISGKLTVEYLLHYSCQDKDNPHNSKATYTGYMFFVGMVNGKSGSFVVEDNGCYTEAGPVSVLSIKPDTGTDELRGISGVGGYGFSDGKMIIEFDLNGD